MVPPVASFNALACFGCPRARGARRPLLFPCCVSMLRVATPERRYTLAAEQGHLAAAFGLGFLFEHGVDGRNRFPGLARDGELAAKWWVSPASERCCPTSERCCPTPEHCCAHQTDIQPSRLLCCECGRCMRTPCLYLLPSIPGTLSSPKLSSSSLVAPLSTAWAPAAKVRPRSFAWGRGRNAARAAASGGAAHARRLGER